MCRHAVGEEQAIVVVGNVPGAAAEPVASRHLLAHIDHREGGRCRKRAPWRLAPQAVLRPL
eukprot:6560669-Lingulodinium_polyedra.AAC.1